MPNVCKSLLLASLLAANVAQAKASTFDMVFSSDIKPSSSLIERECQAMGRLGSTFAAFRQSNTDKQQAIDIENQSRDNHKQIRPSRSSDIDALNELMLTIIDVAYEQPIYTTAEERKAHVIGFGQTVYESCLIALPAGIQQANK